MPNTYIKPEKTVALALAALEKNAILPLAFTQLPDDTFKGARDDKVRVFRSGGVTRARDYEWRTRTQPIVLDRIARTSTFIEMNDHIYNAVPVTDEEMTLDIVSYVTEVLGPQLEAVVDRAEGKVLTQLLSADMAWKTSDLEYNASKPALKQMLAVKTVLDDQGTPKRGRKIVCGTLMGNALLASDDLVKYDTSQAVTAFREATIGRIAGFDIVVSSSIPSERFFAVHPSALAFANTAPVVPASTEGARQTHRGWSLRAIKAWDNAYLSEVSTVSTFAGTGAIKDELQMEKVDGIYVPALVNGEPVYTDKNVRGAAGQFVPEPEPVP